MTQIKHDPRPASRLHELMQEIADDAARAEIESEFPVGRYIEGVFWHHISSDGTNGLMAKIIEYLHLRGLIEYDSSGKLVRFVEGGK